MNSILGTNPYKNTMMGQHPNITTSFRQLFETVKPTQILEIGTYKGGLTLLIRDILNEIGLEDSEIKTFDVDQHIERQYFLDCIENGVKIKFQIKNIFSQNYISLVDEEEIISYINQAGTTIVLCDGGNKKQEFNLLSKYLKVGDIIMAHDYAPNQEYFENYMMNKVWNWCEILDVDVYDVSTKENLVPMLYDEFLQVAWMCKIKNAKNY